MSKSPITCHVLDSTNGKPASGVAVTLYMMQESNFKELSSGSTDNDGRCSSLLQPSTKLATGVYKMRFYTADYFQAQSKSTFYPYVDIPFHYEQDSGHYHVPLLLSQYSYTTYKGS